MAAGAFSSVEPMKILLPPSETKRSGGAGKPLAIESLALPSLSDERRTTIDALVALSAEPDQAQRVLKLSERQLGDLAHNAFLRTSPTMPAVDRYTGVLYDALDATSLDASSRRWLGRHVWIHSAPFGPVSAMDKIPAYRLAAGTSLPGAPPLRKLWAAQTSEAFAEDAPSFVLDLRSEAYVALGPVPRAVPSAYVRVVTAHGKALNHFNKKAKGELMRALSVDRPRLTSLHSLLAWARTHGVALRENGGEGILDLVVDG